VVSEHGILSDSDKKAERSSKKKKGLICGEEKMVAPLQQCNSAFLPSDSDFFTKHEMTLIPQPPYSQDLAKVNFFLSTKLKSILNGQ
jgi:hypothetical protein